MMWTGALIVSECIYQTYPADIQEALARAGQEALAHGRQVSAEMTEEAFKELEERGVTLVGAPSNEEDWQEAAQSIRPQFYDDVGEEEWANEAISIMEAAVGNDQPHSLAPRDRRL